MQSHLIADRQRWLQSILVVDRQNVAENNHQLTLKPRFEERAKYRMPFR
ncbi:MAG: hypothetical protein IPN42_19175 [Methylococcaceae bacterium]|nr:hypothetical protein [Methylococcaceae bacterium]